MNLSKSLKNNLYLIFSIIVLVAGIASTFYYARFSISLADEPYQIMLAQDYKTAPLAFVSSFGGWLWGSTFGWAMLTMRYYAITLQLIALFASGSFLYWRTKRLELSILAVGLCAFFSNGICHFQQHGWDPMSNLTITLAAIMLAVFMITQKLKDIILLAIATAFAIGARVPNAIMVPIEFAIVALYAWHRVSLKKFVKWCGIYTGVLACVLVVLIYLLFGGFSGFGRSIAENSISSHGLRDIVFSWDDYFTKVLPYALFIAILYFPIHFITHKPLAVKIPIITVCLIVIAGFLYTPCVESFDALMHVYYGYLLILIAAIWFSAKTGKTIAVSRLVCLGLLGLSASAGFGSNAAPYKLLTLALLPILFAFTTSHFNQSLRNYTVFLIVVFTPILIMHREVYGFTDGGRATATTKVNHPLLKGVYTKPEKGEALTELIKIIETNKNRELIFLNEGPERYIDYYLSGRINDIDMHNWDFGLTYNRKYIAKIKQVIKNRKNVVVVIRDYAGNVAPMYNTLDSLSSDSVTRTKYYQIYYFNNNQ